MKRNLLLASLCCFLMSATTFAAKSQPIGIKNFTFNPVPWHATFANGGFTLENQTDKIQYVQVTIETGEILVLTISGHSVGNCRQDLNAEGGPKSVVCQLAPNDRLEADIDFAKMAEATGTYQVEMNS